MDKVLGYTVLLTIALTITVCSMAVAMVFGGRFYYFTENSREERFVGTSRRLSVDAPTTFEDGSIFEGVFIVPEGLQYRVTLPRG